MTNTLRDNLERIFLTLKGSEGWMTHPNSELDGETPDSLVKRGEEDKVLKVLKSQMGFWINH